MTVHNTEATAKDQFLTALRTQTMPAHKALEEIPLSTRIVQPDISIDEYNRYLSLMLHVHRDAEQNIYPLLKDVVADVADRQKAHLIEKDLAATGHVAALPHNAPFTDSMPQMSQAFALGIMYVIEGSTLGGRVILKNIQPALQLTEKNGASYFSGYGANTGTAWKAFLEALTSYPTNQTDEQEIIAGADFAFRAIHQHMLQ